MTERGSTATGGTTMARGSTATGGMEMKRSSTATGGMMTARCSTATDDSTTAMGGKGKQGDRRHKDASGVSGVCIRQILGMGDGGDSSAMITSTMTRRRADRSPPCGQQ